MDKTILINGGEWAQTDSSCNQEGRQVSEWVFEFKEDRPTNGGPNPTMYRYERTIDLSAEMLGEVEETLNTFGLTIGNKEGMINVYAQYESQALFIIAECFFELSN